MRIRIIRERSFYLQAAKLVIPVAVQSLITTGINMMDTVMLGSFGELQLSASSLVNQYVMLFQTLCMGIGCGAGVLTAQYYGAGDRKSLKAVINLMYRVALVVGLVVTVFSALRSQWILSIYIDDEGVWEYGVRYMGIMVFTLVPYALSITSTQLLRSFKLMRIPMYASCISFFLNIAANYVFIFGKLGMPRLEIVGAGIGTLIARVFEACFILGYILLKDEKAGFRIRDFLGSCGGQISRFFRYSLPVIVSDMLLGLGTSAQAVIMGHIGAAFVAANSVTSVMSHISTMAVMGFATAAASIVGNTLGKGDKERAYDEGVTFFFLALILGVVGCAVILLARGSVLSLYTLEPETVVIAQQLMEAIAIIVFFRCTSMILTKGVLRAGGDTRFLMVADVFFLWAVSVPFGWLASMVWNFSAFWIYMILMSNTIFKSVICIFRLVSGKWMHQIAAAKPDGTGAKTA